MGEIYRLDGTWEIKPRLSRISGPQGTLTIPPKYMEVLVYLIANAGEVVSRDELLREIWADAVVVEESLTRAVSELRKILQDDPRAPRIIETIPKKGYRLIAPVEKTEQQPPRTRTGHRFGRTAYIALFVIVAAAAFYVFSTQLRTSAAGRGPAVHLMPLTSYPGEESFPVLSPDGNRLAFRWDGEGGYNSSIYVKVIGSENPLRLTNGGITSDPAWSPDGRYISYTRRTARGRAIYMVPSSSGPEQRVAENSYDVYNPVWSPDGDHLLYARESEETGSRLIYLYSLTTGEETLITPAGTNRIVDSKPVFSPTGERIAFIRTDKGEKDVFTISPDGSVMKKVTPGGQWITDVDWAPDGRWIIYSSKEGIWKTTESGGKPVLLTAGGLRIENITVARESWRLAYEQSNREVNIWRMTLPEEIDATHEPKPFISSSRSDSQPVFSPDGRRIAFISDRTGDPQLWICRRDGSAPVQLTHFNGCLVGHPRWSPDGTKITFTAQLYGNSDIFIVNAEGGEPIQITREPSRETTSSWSADGGWIYFTSDRRDEPQIWKIPVDGGDAIEIVNSPSFRPTESADGKTLYYELNPRTSQSIWEKPVNGGRGKKLFSFPDSWIWDWKLTDEGIYYSRSDTSDTFEIGYYDFVSRELTPLYTTSEPAADFGFDPGSRTALFSKLERDEGDIVLMENFQ
ncbi:PD40 domain-containing protein [bacterium]|nr:PD40 domain-containing protein [bacterium]